MLEFGRIKRPSEEYQDRPPQDPQVQPPRPLLQIPGVQFHLPWQQHVTVVGLRVGTGLAQHGRFIDVRELREPGHAGFRREDRSVERIAEVHEARVLWARPDQVHLTSRDVDQLRQLVEPQTPKAAAEARNSLVMLRRDRRPWCIDVPDHRSELQALERTTTGSHSARPVQGWPARLQSHQQSQRDLGRRSQQESEDAKRLMTAVRHDLAPTECVSRSR